MTHINAVLGAGMIGHHQNQGLVNVLRKAYHNDRECTIIWAGERPIFGRVWIHIPFSPLVIIRNFGAPAILALTAPRHLPSASKWSINHWTVFQKADLDSKFEASIPNMGQPTTCGFIAKANPSSAGSSQWWINATRHEEGRDVAGGWVWGHLGAYRIGNYWNYPCQA